MDFAYEMNGNNPIIILGSSYSASLALLISTETEKVKAVIAFSPGEHLKGVKLAEELKSLTKPIFVTSSKSEIDEVSEVLRFVNL